MANLSQPEYVVIARQTADGGYEPYDPATGGGDGATGTGGAPSGFSANANFTPTAVEYGAGDIVDLTKELIFTDYAGASPPAGALIEITTAIVKIPVAIIPAGQLNYLLYLYSAAPPSAQPDNDLWTLSRPDLDVFMGSIDLGTPVDLGQAQYVRTNALGFQTRLTGSSMFARLVTAGRFTPTAMPRTVRLHALVR